MTDFSFINAPNPEDLNQAHEHYHRQGYEGGEYKKATQQIERAFSEGNLVVMSEAIVDFLKVWNRNYYRFHPQELKNLSIDLQKLIAGQLESIRQYRARSLPSLTSSDHGHVLRIFGLFADALRPVGAAKTLHLLAPSFFPLWDDAIACACGVSTAKSICPGKGPDSTSHGGYWPGYFLFMVICKHQVETLAGWLPEGTSPLKILDEYNFCKFTKGWEPDAGRQRQSAAPAS